MTAGKPVGVSVTLVAGSPPQVIWTDGEGRAWRIPHEWRRRRVRLPSCDILVAQGVPDFVAKEYARRIVSVNYHPGSLCCMPDRYRFRPESGGRYPVRIADCELIGYGDDEEYRA